MKETTFTLALIILLALGGWVIWTLQLRWSQENSIGVGKVLLEELAFAEIASITIQSREGEVSLMHRPNRWVVASRFDYPANIAQISNFVKKLRSTKVGRKFLINDEIRKRLQLNQPIQPGLDDSSIGTRVILRNRSGQLMADLLFGKARQLEGTGTPDSHYMMVDNASLVYLVDTPFDTIIKKPQGWMDTPIIEVPAKEVQKIECFSPGAKTPAYVFERKERANDLVLTAHHDKGTVAASKIKKMQWALAYLPLEDVLPPLTDPAAIGITESIRLEYHLFDGVIYRMFPSKPRSETDPYYVKIEMGFKAPAPLPPGTVEAKASLNNENRLSTKKINSKIGKWIYKLSPSHHSGLTLDIKNLLK